MAPPSPATVTADDVAAYLRRLQVEPEPPSADALARLHRAHVECVPYETVWIHLGEAWGIEPADAVRRVAHHRRGGYCYHLNGALSELLRALGYRVTRNIGGVHGPEGPTVAELTNHLVLVVHDLPTDASPHGRWYVDAGLGDALHGPLPMVAGDYVQGPLRFRLAETADGVGDWHLTHDPRGSFTGMSFRVGDVPMDAFAGRHAYLSTSPQSGFVRVLTAQRRTAAGGDVLRGLVLTHADGDHVGTETLDRLDDWLAALGDVFGLVLSHSREVLDAVFTTVAKDHEAWAAAQSPT